MGKGFLGAVGFVILLVLVNFLLIPTIESTTTEDYAEPFSVNTGAGVTTTNETLTYAHWYGDLTNLSAESDNGSDTPVVMSYDPDDYIVNVAGLAQSDSRILTINYVREAYEVFTGFSTFSRLAPFLIIIGGVVALIMGFFAWRRRD